MSIKHEADTRAAGGAEVRIPRETEWICNTEPHCACIAHECEFTCECVKSPTNMRVARCRMCAAPLTEIDAETSEEISP